MIYRVLFTKKLSSESWQLASEGGIEVVEEEMIVVKLGDANAIRPALNQVSEDALVVFTSRNAVRAVANAGGINKAGRIYAVAESTAKDIKKYLNLEAVYGSTNAAGLASMIVQQEAVKEVYFFCGNKKRDELPKTLREAGFDVKEIVVYDTEPAPRQLKDSYDAIAFFSPSAVQSYFELNKPAEGVVCYSIGETTTNELKKYTTGNIFTSHEPSEKCLLQLITARANNSR